MSEQELERNEHSNLCPLDEAHWTSEDGVEVNMLGLCAFLPDGIDPSEIVVDSKMIDKICRVTRTSLLSVTGFREEGEDINLVTGINSDGSATGISIKRKAKSKVVKESTTRSALRRHYENHPLSKKASTFSSVNLQINFERGENLESVDDYASFIDRELSDLLFKLEGEVNSPSVVAATWEILDIFLAYFCSHFGIAFFVIFLLDRMSHRPNGNKIGNYEIALYLLAIIGDCLYPHIGIKYEILYALLMAKGVNCFALESVDPAFNIAGFEVHRHLIARKILTFNTLVKVASEPYEDKEELT